MKTAWKLCLALALMVASLLVVRVPAFAAGTHTVSGTYKLDDEGSTKDTSFKLYHVGRFGRTDDGKAILVLDEAISDRVPTDITIDLGIEKGDETDEEWQEAWLEQAALVAKYLPNDTEPVATAAIAGNDGKFTFTPAVEDGLYLVCSDSDPVITYDAEDKGLAWTPQPMLVMVLNDDVDITIKPVSEPLVKNVTVYKTWEDEGHENLRPDSIQVQLTYNDEAEGQPVSLVEEDGVLKYEWTNLEKVKGVYDVVEIMSDDMMANYTVSYSSNESGNTKTINITNKYDRYNLSLLKKMKAFIANGDQATTTFVFEVEGYDAAEGGKVVYTTRVGVQVKDGDTEKEITVPDIPRTVKRITVREIYAGGYEPDSTEAKQAAFTVSEDEGGVYSVEFTNDFDTPVYSGGVINKFKFDADKEPNYTWKALGSVFSSED